MIEYMRNLKNKAFEMGQGAVAKAKPYLAKLKKKLELVSETTITGSSLIMTTLFAWLNNNSIDMTMRIANDEHYRPSLTCQDTKEYGIIRGTSNFNYGVVGIDFNKRTFKAFINQAVLLSLATITLLTIFRAKRRVQVAKLENATIASKDLKTIKENYDTIWLPMQVSELLNLGIDTKTLSEKEKFEVLANYMKGGFPQALLFRIIKEQELINTKDESENNLLHVAAEAGNADLVKRLISLEFSFNPFLENKKGVKPRTLAYSSEPLVAEMLLQQERMHYVLNTRVTLYANSAGSAATSRQAAWSSPVTVNINPDKKMSGV
jgi:hypothetical protein